MLMGRYFRSAQQLQHRGEYRRVLDALDGRPLVVRTLDVGGDKPLPYWPMPAEENPFLGVRGSSEGESDYPRLDLIIPPI